MKRLVKKAGNKKLYNGVDFKSLDNIILIGLIPQFVGFGGAQLGGGNNGDQNKLNNYKGFTFFATDIRMAYNYGESQCNGDYPIVVIEFNIDEDKLLPDDTDCLDCKTWQESESQIRQVKCKGSIQPESIEKIHFFNTDTGELVFSSSPENWKQDYEENESKFDW